MHLGGICSFFIAWLTNFKLLSLAFGKGPLSDPSLSLPKFLAIGCFPIKIQQNPPPKTTQTDPNKENPSPQNTQKGHKSLGNYAIKIALVAMFVHIEQGEYVHPKLMLVMYCLHIYFMLELMLGGSSRGSSHPEFRARATVQRPIPLNISSRLLGKKMEHHGLSYPAPYRIRSCPQNLDEDCGPKMGPIACRVQHVCSVGLNA
ncbi:Acyl-CoA--sterol O-acyltransferase 1 [Camellia lanceoleosa]|uniref:Acyl-CoA--sterol O-acyltransferase 1 n=1 Tax=Camellia lanceoleosa TaxID=1840588 RepID=A0ACC0GLN0_9ERIC|nr:Acyl-CoA--sterol O-acyltransferase 1 [Camellia lanceoleosa]